MKKTISLVLTVVMLMLSLPVMAATDDAQKMQSVLLLVKDKISIPGELTEFSGNVSEYNGNSTYHFEWTTLDYGKSMSVSCDDMGRITSYYYSGFEMSDKRISAITKAEIISFAEEFLKKTIPEAFADENDRLFYDESSYNASGNLRYSLGFLRKKGDVLVNNSYANVTVCIAEDKMYVRSMNVAFDYAATFAENVSELENYEEKYMELFPTELVYQDEYKPLAKANEARYTPRLIYRIKDNDIGYMDISTGKILKEDIGDYGYRKEAFSEDAAVNMQVSGGGSSLSPQEMAEIEQVEGLLSIDEIIESIRKLPYLDFSDDLEMRSSSLYKDDFGKYYYRINYALDNNNAYKYFNVRVNAETGEIINLTSNSRGYNDEMTLTAEEKAEAEEKIDEFLMLVAKDKLLEVSEETSEDYAERVSRRFVRIVNGVKYVDDGISISFDGKNKLVRSYNLDFADGDFASPENAIGEAAAYAKILDKYEISPVYIKNGGEYKKAVTLTCRYVQLDAVSGEIINPAESKEYGYDDISGHWAEEAATKLAQIQIGISGERLEPDRKMTQEEFLRFASAGIIDKYYSDGETEVFYDRLIRDKFVLAEEKNPMAEIAREDAFVFVIRMAGFEKVAKLSDIYKVTYSDQNLLSEGRIGYAAILSGLGIISGDGGFLRPQDSLTRAEAMVMVYKYLLSL